MRTGDHMTMSFSAADQKKIDIMGCCFRKPVDCPKVRDGTNRCTVASNLFSSRRAASVVSSFAKAARGPDEMEPGVIELIASRATNKKCTRWKSGRCHEAESHGPFPQPTARRRNPSRSAREPGWVCILGAACIYRDHVERVAPPGAHKRELQKNME